MEILAALRRLPPLAVDAVITIACGLNVVLQAAIDGRLEWWVPAVASVYALPLMWRRRYPFAMTLLCGLGTSFLAPTKLLGQFPAVQLVMTYTFADLCPPAKRAMAIAGTVAGVTGSILIPGDEYANLGVVGMAFAVAHALGTTARARRDRIAMLEERALRHAEEEQAAATRERERIAREMHDILAHSVSMIAIQAEGGSAVVRSDPGRAERVFDTIAGTARDTLAQLRRVLGVLRSQDTDRRPLPGLDALPALAAGVRDAGLEVRLEEDGPARPVPPDLAATAYRIVQESLTNVVKHAGAGTVLVRVRWDEGALRLEVSDDGRGAADGAANGSGGGGHGLTGMRERVTAAGGELIYGPRADGTGFRVAATLPLI